MMWLEGLGKLKKFIDLIGTRTCNLPICSIVPQPSTLLYAPNVHELKSRGSNSEGTGMLHYVYIPNLHVSYRTSFIFLQELTSIFML
jgi:hypothetical protein